MTRQVLCFFLLTLIIISGSSDLHTRDKDSLLLQISQLPEGDIGHLHAKALLANILLRENLDTAGVLLRESSLLADKHDHPVARSDWLNSSGAYNWYGGNRDSAMVNYRIIYSMDHPDITDTRAAAAVNLASLFRMRMQEDSTLYYFSMARRLFAEVGDSAGIAHTDYSLASKYYRQDNFDMALDYALRAYAYRQTQQDTFDLIYSHLSLGNIYNRLRNNENAKKHYERSLDLIEQHPNHPARSSIYNSLSNFMAWRIGDYNEALRYNKMAIDLAKERERFEDLFAIYNNRSKILTSQEKYQQALDYHKRADAYYSDDIIEEIVAGAKNARGMAYKGLGDYQKARQLFQEGLQQASSGKALSRMQDANDYLFQLDSIEGNYIQAIARLQEAHRLHNEIWEKERTNRISELRIIHETAQIEAENRMLQESNRLKEAVIDNQRRLLLLGIVAISLILLLLLTILWSRWKLKKKNNELEDLQKKLVEKQFRITRQNKELDRQKNDLEELNRTKDKFFSIIAHDLKGPFTALLGYLDMLLEDYHDMDEDEKLEMLNNLNKTSNNAYNLTVNLLEWANLQMNRIEVTPESFSLPEKVDQVLASLEFSIQKKELEIINKVPAIQPAADPHIVQSILTNLINNAVKFTPRDGCIVIEAKQLDSDMVEVCVIDNGIGIAKEKQDKLFEMASSYRHPGTEGETGTGLGLMTTKDFVELLGGTIKISSELNEGSCFCFTFIDHSAEGAGFE